MLPALATLIFWFPFASAEIPETVPPVPLYEFQLQLAKEPRPYVQILPDAVIVYLRALQVKHLSVNRYLAPREGKLSMSRVAYLEPEAPSVVIDATEPDEASLLTLDSIVGLERMPSTYVIHLEDGTRIFITSRQSEWQFYEALASDPSTAQVDERVYFLRMPEDGARELHWALEPGMGVIY